MAGYIKMPLGIEVGPIPGDFVFNGDPASLPKKGAEPPNFRPCGQYCCIWIKMPIGTVVGLSPGDFVLDGDPATPTKKDTPIPTQFLAHVYCGQTAAGWMKTPLGAEVDLGTGHIVLDVVSAVRERDTTAPSFGPCMATVAHLCYC